MSLITDVGPTIATQPQAMAVNLGSNATFSVVAGGATPLYYQWRFNAANLLAATASSYTRTNAQPGDAGNYSVVVSNSLGSISSSNALLTVNVPPSITSQPLSQTVPLGQSATFSVSAVGSAPLVYQWRFNGLAIAGATSSAYTIAFAQPTNSGAYSALVTNGVASIVSSNASLAVVQLAAGGEDSWGQINLRPDFTNAVAVAAGAWHSLALRADGVVIAWGDSFNGQCAVPPTLTDALAIAGGGYHSLAIKANGKVVAWGANDYGQTNVPAALANVIGIAAGTWHSVALRADGSLAVWGDNSLGQTNLPFGLTNVVAVTAGGNHSLALKADGTVVAWGENTDSGGTFVGQSVVPSGLTNVLAIAAGEYHSLAAKNDGTVVAWGDNSQNQCALPPNLTNAVAIAGGGAHSLALKSDGTVAAWGANGNGQCNISPTLTNAVGIAAGEAHTLLLLEGSAPVRRLFNPARNRNGFSVVLQTLNRHNYTLEFKNSLSATNWTPLSTNMGNGVLKMLSDPSAAVRQRFYRVR